MTLARLIHRNLVHYWRTNLAVLAGVATAVSVLSGALLVGESVRSSLRNLVYQRLGASAYLVAADRFFREELADELEPGTDPVALRQAAPVIHLEGVLVREQTGARALKVNVFGIDARFWQIHGQNIRPAPQGREALIGAPLAEKLGARPGDALLLRLETQQAIPRESLYGRRESVGRTIRLDCSGILSAEELGEFSLRPSQATVHTIFVPLSRLQRDLTQPGRANTVLLAAGSGSGKREAVSSLLAARATLEDLGIRLRPLAAHRVILIESPRMLIDDAVAQAAFAAAAEAGFESSGVLTYMANSIRSGGREIPYSIITAADLGKGALASVSLSEGLSPSREPDPDRDAIWLNEWAARDLGVQPGAAVEVDFYLWQDEGRLATRTARFRFSGAVRIGGDISAELTPDYPGITEARAIGDWDPPFPIDLQRIRPQDEEYWNRHKATPKAFVSLAAGQELWRSRYGNLSAVRVAIPGGTDPDAAAEELSQRLRRRVHPEEAGFSIIDLGEQGLTASRGPTDFGEYFVYFSFFLIVSAVLLAALFFRLGVEQRVREIGTLRALGFPLATLQRIFLAEGAFLSLAGSLAGLLGAIAYGGLMMFGLRTWWVGAVGTRSLFLSVSSIHLALGAAAGILVSLATIAWTLRGLRRNPPRALLAGALESFALRRRRARSVGIVSAASFVAAGLLLAAAAFGALPDVAGFFGAGFLLLISALGVAALYLRRPEPRLLSGRGWAPLVRLGARNCTYRPGRSLLSISLIAAATFIIVSTEAFRRDPAGISLDRESGTGGYPLLAASSLPVLYDPNNDEGREALGITASELPNLESLRFVPFRVRPGDDTSCLNLYAPQNPRVLGVPPSFIAEGRFSFQDSLSASPEEELNPWLLLESGTPDDAIPAIGDANTIQYILHLKVGGELAVRSSAGAPVKLRLVAALRDSIFQGELLISEANFLRLFPAHEGFRFFLLDAPPQSAAALIRPLEERLAEWGFALEDTRDRLAAFHRVENTYLSTFQSLGGLGLVLGTVGLGTVLLRNVLERRKELALLRAVGYRRLFVSAIVISENLALMAVGLACGALCASLAILPALAARSMAFPVGMVGIILAAVLLAGLAASLAAVRAAIGSPLLDALRSE